MADDGSDLIGLLVYLPERSVLEPLVVERTLPGGRVEARALEESEDLFLDRDERENPTGTGSDPVTEVSRGALAASGIRFPGHPISGVRPGGPFRRSTARCGARMPASRAAAAWRSSKLTRALIGERVAAAATWMASRARSAGSASASASASARKAHNGRGCAGCVTSEPPATNSHLD
jgi:hypothetical protein